MRTKILRYALSCSFMVATLTVLGQESEKAAQARKDFNDARIDISQAKVDSSQDFQAFRNEAGLKLADNQRKIEVLKTKRPGGNQAAKDKYTKAVTTLQQRNNDLKKKIKASDSIKTSKWSAFKQDFNRELDELDRAIKETVTDNTM